MTNFVFMIGKKLILGRERAIFIRIQCLFRQLLDTYNLTMDVSKYVLKIYLTGIGYSVLKL